MNFCPEVKNMIIFVIILVFRATNDSVMYIFKHSYNTHANI